jgi:hypothetical protein
LAEEVRFQRLFDGEPMDDIVVIGSLPAGQAKLALQVKRDLTFGEKNEIFLEVMSACWKTFTSPKFTYGIDRFGIAVGLYSKTVDEHYQQVLAWARASASAEDFFKRIQAKGLSNETQRSFVALIRGALVASADGQPSDDELWRFLRSMVILYFSFQGEGTGERFHATETVRQALPAGQQGRAHELFGKLVEYAATGHTTAGSYSVETLREGLQSDGYVLAAVPDCASDLARLSEEAEFALADIQSDIAGVVLPRTELLSEARGLVGANRLVEFVGAAGSGKSALLKLLAEEGQGDGAPIVLAGDRIVGPGWAGYASMLGLARRQAELLQAAGVGNAPTLFIDGLDRVNDPGARRTVNDLLRGVASRSASGRPWTVVVTMREENRLDVHTWIDLRGLGQPAMLEMSEMSKEEADVVGEQIPRLRPLLGVSRLQPVTRNPFLLNVVADPRMAGPAAGAGTPATEVEVSQAWWERVVGHGAAAGRERQQALLTLGRRVIATPGRPASGEGVPAEALFSLENDGILRREPGRDVYRFRHDIFEDWVLARVLDQRRGDLPDYLLGLSQPNGLSQPLQHLAATLLETGEGPEQWLHLLDRFESDGRLSPRWRRALLTAPLTSPRAAELLEKTEVALLEGDGSRLNDLLVALRTSEVSPDLAILPAAQQVASEPEEVLPLLLSVPLPHWLTWYRFLSWLVPRLGQIPGSVRPEIVKLMDIWLQKSPYGAPYRKELGETALRWLEEVEHWRWYGRP